MKNIRLLIAVALSFTLASAGSIYAMKGDGGDGGGDSSSSSGGGSEELLGSGGDASTGGGALGDGGSPTLHDSSGGGSSADKISLLNWVNSMDKGFLDWFGETGFGSKCALGVIITGLYAAHPHATKAVLVAVVFTGFYWLWKKRNKRRKEIEEWADED